MFKIQKGSPFYSTLITLVLLCQIPLKFEGSYTKYFFIACSSFRLAAFLIVSIGPVLHYIMAVQGNIEVDISENISTTVSTIGALLTCIQFSYQYKKWLQFYKDITDHRIFGKPTDYYDLVKYLNRLSFIYTCYCTMGVPIYGATGHFGSIDCDSAAMKKGFFCKSFTPIWLPFNATDFTLRIVIWIIQMVLAGFIVCASAVVNFMVWEATAMLISHINNLKTHFNKIGEGSTEQESSDLVGFCIQYHNHILSYICFSLANRLNLLIKHTSGHMTLISAIIFAVIGNQIYNTKSLGATLYLVGYIGALFFICHAGQRIRDELMSIGDAIYNSYWYATDVRTMKSLRFVIARCQIPFHYDAVPLGEINYALFVMVIKTSYSYVTLLTQST